MGVRGAQRKSYLKKLLQVLTILILLLTAGALALGIMLFGKRELLKGRTVALEKGLVQIASLLETPTDPELTPANFTEKDISEVAAQAVLEPTRATFWKDYPLFLENADQALVSIRREDLMNYYKIDPVTGRPLKGQTEGEGTLDAALKKIDAAAQYELELLNKTRHQLAALRAELIKTIEELNDGKQRQRASLAHIVELNTQIAGLQEDIRQKEAAIAALEAEKQTLQDTVAAQEITITDMTEKIQLLEDTVATQRKKIEDLIANAKIGDVQRLASLSLVNSIMEAGRKGRVVSVNQEWSYVVLELDDKTLSEIAELRKEAPGIPVVEMFLKRGENGPVVTKIKLTQIKSDEKLAIASVLTDWQQMPVVAGDIAFY